MAVGMNVQKVTPIERATRRDNNIVEFNIANRLKYLIYIELLLGINRIPLLDCSKTKYWISQLFTPFLLAILLYLIIFSGSEGATAMAFRNTYCVEFLLLSISASYIQGARLRGFFRKLNEFDKGLNLEKEQIFPQPKTSVIFIMIIITSLIVEGSLLNDIRNALYVIYLGVLIHESEKMFFCTLLYTVLTRIRILKAHVLKELSFKGKNRGNLKDGDKIKALTNKVKLDINDLHKAYELLHKISEDLNAGMSFSMIVMFFSSGICTILLLKSVFNSFQASEVSTTVQLASLYKIMHCIKLTLLMVIPCYMSNSTYAEVTIIRTVLHDALDNNNKGKLEKRKIKAFYQLTRDNDLAYVLWGLIKLDMSLPLNYSSLCTTYLVIILQFSKFID